MADNVISKIKLPDNQEYILKDSDAARSNHTHDISLEKDTSGTNQLTLAAGTKYKLTAGGESYIFTTPADANNKVTIAADTTTNANYPLVFGSTNTSTTTAKTEGLQKSTTKFYVNPSTGNIQATTFNGIALTAAAGKSITDNSSNADVTSSDTNLITGRTLYYQLAKKGYTTNTGTVTNVATGVGLTGGPIATTGTIKANLTSDDKLTNAAADGTETAGRVYPVRLDKDGKLAVNVPWTNVNGSYLTSITTTGNGNAITAVEKSGQSITFTKGSTFLTSVPNSFLKWQTTTSASTDLYDFGVYVNQNNAASSSMNGGNYFSILNIPYRKASGNTKADWGWQIGNTTSNDGRLWYRTSGDNVWGDWQTIAHATQSTSNIGSTTQPVYMTAAGVITAGTPLKNLAYKDSLSAADIPELAASKITSGTFDTARIPNLAWSKITSGKPTTLSGYGITDAKIASGVITLGSNTITPVTSVNGHTGNVVNVTAGDLGLSSALRYVGKTTSTMSESFTGVPAGISGYTKPIVGDVVLDSAGNGEYVCVGVSGTTYTWESLGSESSFKKVQTAVSSPSAGDNAQIEFIDTISQNAQGVISATKQPIRTASKTQTGVIQITQDNANLFLNTLSIGSSAPSDNDYYISQYANGGTTTTTYHRRPVSKLYDYIKSKTDTLYPTKAGGGATGTWGISISGNAATATTATKFASAQSVTLTGDASGTASSQAGWSISTVNKYITGRGRLESADIENASYLSKFFTFLSSSSMTTSKPRADGSIAYFGWDNSGWAGELYVPNAKNGQLQFRGASNSDGTSDWEDWVTVLDTRNYTTTLDSTYVKKANGVTAVTWDSTNKKITRTINGTAADVVAFEGTSPITVTGAANKLTIAHNGNSGYKHIPSGGSSGQFLGWDSDGTAKWVANPNSDTKVTLAAITSGTAYYPVVGTGTGNAQRQIDTTGFAYKGTNGTTSAVGAAELTLGNSTASGTANNKQGKLTLYGSTAYTHTLLGAPTSARTITLPDATGTVELTNHIHGNLSHDGKITSTTTIANGDKLVIVDSDSKIIGSSITFDGSTTTKALTQKGTWETFNNYSHPTGDGNLHVPATGTTHNGQVLKAGSTAGSISWGTLSASDVGALAAGGNAVSATTATNLSAAPTITATGTATINLAANTTYTLTVGGKSVVFKTPSDANTNTLVNYTLGETTKAYLMASQNAPTTTTTARAAHGDTGVYLTATAGEFSAVRHSYNVAGVERAYTHYNMTDQSIDFIFV